MRDDRGSDGQSEDESEDETLKQYRHKAALRRTIAFQKDAPAAKKARMGTRLLRLKEARKDLTHQRRAQTPILLGVVAQEWRAMAHEDVTAHYLQPYLAAPHNRVKALKPAYDFALRRSSILHSSSNAHGFCEFSNLCTVADLDVFLKSLLVEEDGEDAKHSDNLAVKDESRALSFAVEQGKLNAPFYLGELAVYWLATEGDRIQRRTRRRDLRWTIQSRTEMEAENTVEGARPEIQQTPLEELRSPPRGGRALFSGIFRRKHPKL